MKHFCSFSEAIREGAKLRPQAFNDLLIRGATCAVGAGLEAMGCQIEGRTTFDYLGYDYGPLRSIYPYLSRSVDCPASPCMHVRRPIVDTIFDLNDEHRWTREQIADWLESEEEKLGFVTLVEASAIEVAQAATGDQQ